MKEVLSDFFISLQKCTYFVTFHCTDWKIMYNNIQRYDKERGVYYEEIKKKIHGDACERSKADY